MYPLWWWHDRPVDQNNKKWNVQSSSIFILKIMDNENWLIYLLNWKKETGLICLSLFANESWGFPVLENKSLPNKSGFFQVFTTRDLLKVFEI